MSSMQGKTIFITGGSRGIGRAVALRCAADGANIVIAAKSNEPHPKLGGSIHTVAQEIIEQGGQALPLQMDVREEQQVIDALAKAADHFGGIDVLIHNAGAIHLGNVEHTSVKKYDLIQTLNHRGLFIAAHHALPYLKKSAHGQILSFSPPINLSAHWMGMYSPYALSKYGMTMLILGLAEELKGHGVLCNSLWPATFINTAAVSVNIGTDAATLMSRKPEIMADAAHAILSGGLGYITGQTLLDEEVLKRMGMDDLSHYACSPEHIDRLAKDLFVD